MEEANPVSQLQLIKVNKSVFWVTMSMDGLVWSILLYSSLEVQSILKPFQTSLLDCCVVCRWWDYDVYTLYNTMSVFPCANCPVFFYSTNFWEEPHGKEGTFSVILTIVHMRSHTVEAQSVDAGWGLVWGQLKWFLGVTPCHSPSGLLYLVQKSLLTISRWQIWFNEKGYWIWNQKS